MLAVFTGSLLLVFNFNVKFKYSMSGRCMPFGAENLDLDLSPPCNLLLHKCVSCGRSQSPTHRGTAIDPLPIGRTMTIQ